VVGARHRVSEGGPEMGSEPRAGERRPAAPRRGLRSIRARLMTISAAGGEPAHDVTEVIGR
jgi:hypothetical protein